MSKNPKMIHGKETGNKIIPNLAEIKRQKKIIKMIKKVFKRPTIK